LRGLNNRHWTAALEQTRSFENLPPAVILDLDETVLDNSVFESRLVAASGHFTDEAWTKWIDEKSAALVPGALHFLQFAQAHGVATIYVTNRSCDPTNPDDVTVKVLENLHVPIETISARLMCSQDRKDEDKTLRRMKCAKQFRILLLVGDQLGDFLQIPSTSATLDGRQKLYEAHQNLWGERWFLLPNPMYGSWESAVGYDTNQKLSHLKK
jgi:5'-nucleotidase (lipoprotein e(P4) family)